MVFETNGAGDCSVFRIVRKDEKQYNFYNIRILSHGIKGAV